MTGYMLLSGDAGEEEPVKGYAWTVSVNGYEGAKEVLDYASLSMKESQIKMARRWRNNALFQKQEIARRTRGDRFLDNSNFKSKDGLPR